MAVENFDIATAAADWAAADQEVECPVEDPGEADAEVAVWRGDSGDFIELHGDSVEGWVAPVSLEAAIAAAEKDDEAAIRAALVRREES